MPVSEGIYQQMGLDPRGLQSRPFPDCSSCAECPLQLLIQLQELLHVELEHASHPRMNISYIQTSVLAFPHLSCLPYIVLLSTVLTGTEGKKGEGKARSGGAEMFLTRLACFTKSNAQDTANGTPQHCLEVVLCEMDEVQRSRFSQDEIRCLKSQARWNV